MCNYNFKEEKIKSIYEEFLEYEIYNRSGWLKSYYKYHSALVEIIKLAGDRGIDEDEKTTKDILNDIFAEADHSENADEMFFGASDNTERNAENFIEKLWRSTHLGATSIQRGRFSESDFEKIKEENKEEEDEERIYEITGEIFNTYLKENIKYGKNELEDILVENNFESVSLVESYQDRRGQMKELKDDLDLNRMSWSSLKRIYSLLFPGIFTTIVNRNIYTVFDEVAEFDENEDDNAFNRNWQNINILLMKQFFDFNDDYKDEKDKIKDKIEDKIKVETEIDSNLISRIIDSMFYWHFYGKMKEDLTLKKQMVYYGVPGTGKTYDAQREAENIFNIWQRKLNSILEEGNKLDLDSKNFIEIVQFHPSFTYEDFIEGIRPVITGDNEDESELKIVNGIFKKFCKKASNWNNRLRLVFGSTNEEDQILNGNLSSLHDLLENNDIENITDNDSNNVISDKVLKLLKADDGKTHIPTEEQKIWKALFKASKKKAQNQEGGKAEDIIDYLPPYIFIIDEINRAELSQVLGELMYCLEYRGLEGKVRTQFSYLIDKNNQSKSREKYSWLAENDEIFFWDENETNGGKNYFYIPQNLYLLGTMNTIDRSVETFDFALRRRFLWRKKEPSRKTLKNYLRRNLSANHFNENNKVSEKIKDICKAFEKLNQKIEKEPLLGSEYKIGHTYFFDLEEILIMCQGDLEEALDKLWNDNLKPLLEEYLRGVQSRDDMDDTLGDLKDALKGNEEE